MKIFIQLILLLIIMFFFVNYEYKEEMNVVIDKSKFQIVLENWSQNGGDLSEALDTFYDDPIKKRTDAIALSNALKSISLNSPSEENIFGSPLFTLASFFQNVETKSAHDEFVNKGLPELRRLLKEGLKKSKNVEGDLLFLLKILAIYKQKEDTIIIAEVAQSAFQSDEYMWSVIFSIFDEDHPYSSLLIDKLRSPLPKDFIGIAYLDLVNGHAINNNLENHPFNSLNGTERLENLLAESNDEYYSYAHSATVALPFIDKQKRKPLIKIAFNHPDESVQIESAWVLAKISNVQGVNSLKQWTLNVNHSTVARKYLNELSLGHEIPTQALEENFIAMAEMASWLAHPNEFGRPPNKIELYDTRIMYWPPTDDKRRVWLFKYKYEPTKDEEESDDGIAMVGSVTFALFGEATSELKPIEVYGIHCAWELEGNEDKRAPVKRTVQSGVKIIKQYNPSI